MRFNSLQEWLNWQESLNPKEIDLGLDRVAAVLQKLDLAADFSCPVITVAGTNGKGSTVAFIESILLQAGYKVGCYTSPHLFDYNERIRINQQNVRDAMLCEAFESVDQARQEIPLTYFEFGTLAALVLFNRLQLDVVVLEVGLGGRLDAVNVINPDVAVITSIAIDHVDWLGNDVETIAREKAGIMRSGRPCIVSLAQPPQSLLDYAQEISAPLTVLAKDYLYQSLSGEHWQLRSNRLYLPELCAPSLQGSFQLQNAAAAIMAVDALDGIELPNQQQINRALQQARLQGRYQQLQRAPSVIVDVAHNEQSATMLAQVLADDVTEGKTLAVVAMLADKAVQETLQVVSPQVDHWFSAGLEVPRGMPAKNMAQAVRAVQADDKITDCDTVEQACQQALSQAGENDRVIVFGSFYTVGAAMRYFSEGNH